jgi:hypothetical protein
MNAHADLEVFDEEGACHECGAGPRDACRPGCSNAEPEWEDCLESCGRPVPPGRQICSTCWHRFFDVETEDWNE